MQASEVTAKFLASLADSQPWCDQVRHAAEKYEGLASPAGEPSAAEAVSGRLAGKRYLDPDMFARALSQLTHELGCKLGDESALQKQRDDEAKAESWRREAEVAEAGRQACLAASRGDVGALEEVLKSSPQLAKSARQSVMPFSSNGGLECLGREGHCYATGQGHSLLTLACEHGHAECVEALLRRGADPNLKVSYSKRWKEGTCSHVYTPLHLVLKTDSYSEATPGAARLACVASLLRHRADVHAVASHVTDCRNSRAHGMTPLHLAAALEGSDGKGSEIVTLLLEHQNSQGGDQQGGDQQGGGALLGVKDGRGRVPLECAATVAAATLLIEADPGIDTAVLRSAHRNVASALHRDEQYSHSDPDGSRAEEKRRLLAILEEAADR